MKKLLLLLLLIACGKDGKEINTTITLYPKDTIIMIYEDVIIEDFTIYTYGCLKIELINGVEVNYCGNYIIKEEYK